MRYVVGDVLTGRIAASFEPTSGPWSEVLNGAGGVSATANLQDPYTRGLRLGQQAVPAKAFLAVLDGDVVLQAGPVWAHQPYDANAQSLSLVASGWWSYADARVLITPGFVPTDEDSDVNVTSSLQGIAVGWLDVMMDHPNTPVFILPSAIAGTEERNELGVNLGSVGRRLYDLTQVQGGPDIRFVPRLSSDRLSLEVVVEIGTPDKPQLVSPHRARFVWGAAKSSLSDLRVTSSGSRVASKVYYSGGRQADEVLMSTASNALEASGFPLLESVDSSHSTVSEQATLDSWAAEGAVSAASPVLSIEFKHDLSQRPHLGDFRAGDECVLQSVGDPYLLDGDYTLRITARSGDVDGLKVKVTGQPISFVPAPSVDGGFGMGPYGYGPFGGV